MIRSLFISELKRTFASNMLIAGAPAVAIDVFEKVTFAASSGLIWRGVDGSVILANASQRNVLWRRGETSRQLWPLNEP